MTSGTAINLKAATPSTTSSSKPIPAASLLAPWQFEYASSPDGKDINLLIMFHGLGDTKAAFAGLGKQLNLPSTAVLSLQAPDPLPLMETPSWSWFNTFTPLFEPLPNPSPAKTLPKLRSLVTNLLAIGWDPTQIHLFGWGQGGSMAMELSLDIGQNPLLHPSATKQSGENNGPPTSLSVRRLGSCISICAPLLSFPSRDIHVETPLLSFSRSDPRSATAKKQDTALKRAFKVVKSVSGQGTGEGMPRGKNEWEGIMRFWGELLIRDESWKGDGEVYEVVR